MAYDPNMIMNFVNQNNNGLLTGIGQGINQLVTNKRAEIAAAEKEKLWQTGLANYMGNKSYENGIALYNANPEKWADFQEADKFMTEAQNTQTVQQNMEIIAHLDTGNTEGAIANLKKIRDANLADGNPDNNDEAHAIDGLIETIQNGQGDDVSTLLEMRNFGMGEIGQSAMKAFNENKAEGRAKTELGMKIFEEGRKYVGDQNTLNSLIDAAELDQEYGKDILAQLNYSRALENGAPVDPEFKASERLKLQDRWYDRTEELRSAGISNTKLQEAYKVATSTDGGNAGWADKDGNPVEKGTPGAIEISGMADLTIMNLYQRQIDDAVVRKDDILNIEETAGLATGSIKRFINKIMNGQKLTPQQRDQMSQLSQMLYEANETYVDNDIYPAIGASMDLLMLNDKEIESVIGKYIPPDQRGKEEVPEEVPPAESPDTPADVVDMKKSMLEVANAGVANGTWTKEEIASLHAATTMEELKALGPKTFQGILDGNDTGAVIITADDLSEDALDIYGYKE